MHIRMVIIIISIISIINLVIIMHNINYYYYSYVFVCSMPGQNRGVPKHAVAAPAVLII